MNTSQSVWYEEVDRGLKQLVKKTLGDIPVIFTPNRDSNLDGKENPYSKPTYPYVRILHLGEAFDPVRFSRNDILLSTDPENNQAIIGKSARPYNLNYQIELIANKQLISNDITRLWNFEVIDKYNLDVLDKSGNPRNCYMTRTVATTVMEADQLDDKIFRNIYKYKIRVELDEQITYTVPMVTSVNLHFDDN